MWTTARRKNSSKYAAINSRKHIHHKGLTILSKYKRQSNYYFHKESRFLRQGIRKVDNINHIKYNSVELEDIDDKKNIPASQHKKKKRTWLQVQAEKDAYAKDEKRAQKTGTVMVYRSLRNKDEFDRVFQEGERINGRLTAAVIRKNTGSTKLGIIVNSRYGSAVIRNRVKRKTREAFRAIEGTFRRPTEWVIMPKESSKRSKTDEIKMDLINIAGKGRI